MEIVTSFEKNKIINADCFTILPQIPDKSVDFILSDLPYGTTGELKWDSILPLDKIWSEYHRIIKPNGAIALFGQDPFTSKLIMSNLNEFKYRWVWEKSKASNYLHAKQQPLRAHEDIAIFYSGQCTYNPQFTYDKPYHLKERERLAPAYGSRGRAVAIESTDGRRYPRTVLKYKTAENDEPSRHTYHPTQKPIELLEYFIKTYTNEGETVLDNCAGSFSTCIAAQNCNRNWIGIEREQEYCFKAKDRFEKLETKKEENTNEKT